MNRDLLNINRQCRVCAGKNLQKFLQLGPQPLANSFLAKAKLKNANDELFFPMDVYLCAECGLVQLIHVVKPEVMFRHYLYVTATSPVLVAHFKHLANQAVDTFRLDRNSLVVDIGANDGTLLRHFKARKIRVLGVDPAVNIARRTTASGIRVIAAFFGASVAQKIRKQYGPVHVVTGANVLAHVNDLKDFVTGIQIILDDNGVFIIEVPYIVDFIERNLFDTVYHEHLSYFGIKPLVCLFQQFDMQVFDVQRVAAQGGSIRVFVRKNSGKHRVKQSVSRLLSIEKYLKLHTLQEWKKFAIRVRENKKELRSMLAQLKKQGKTIVGYGAAAKGNTLLNYFGITPSILDFIVDDSTYKLGYYTPGTHIKVEPTALLYKNRPDYVLILAWNFASSIMDMHKKLEKLGTHFIVPMPKPVIL